VGGGIISRLQYSEVGYGVLSYKQSGEPRNYESRSFGKSGAGVFFRVRDTTEAEKL